jgi:hypothetical protein
MAVKRGDIVLEPVPDTSGKPGKTRPALVVSSNHNKSKRKTINDDLWRGAFSRTIMPNSNQPPLKPLHVDSSLIGSKLVKYAKLSDQELIDSLKPGQLGSLKVRPEETIIDGHHRIKILRDRGVDVDSLPREIIPRDAISDPP